MIEFKTKVGAYRVIVEEHEKYGYKQLEHPSLDIVTNIFVTTSGDVCFKMKDGDEIVIYAVSEESAYNMVNAYKYLMLNIS